MDFQLSEGTLLDGRYRIVQALGQGGFGITYLAENIRLGMRVAVKELFWREHCSRSAEEPSRVTLNDLREAPLFASQMERFLREARTLRDFADEPGIVRILDYFEANATAYIVMEYIEGETLAQLVARQGPLPEKEALAAFLPLARTLAAVHRSGIIHRDISPENIMVRPGPQMTLIDFGAARSDLQEKSFTAIGKAHYSAPEQHDRNGKQGPWTDVYGFCAALYFCLTGVSPDTAVQRLFLDELRAPSAVVPAVSSPVSALVMRGLEMDQGRRFQDMDALAGEMQRLLPDEHPHPRRWWAFLAAGLFLLLAVFGVFQYVSWRQDNPFYGMEILRLRLTPGAGLSARDYAAYQEKLGERLSAFAGQGQYRITSDGASLEVTLPAALFADAPAGETLKTVLFTEDDSEDERAIRLESEILVSWEDPAQSLIAGEHQVLPSYFSEDTLLFVYEPYSALTKGQRASLIIDLKVRLDALGVPYAFGTERGADSRFVFRLPPSHVGIAVLDSIGSNYFYFGSTMYTGQHIYCSSGNTAFSVETLSDGRRALVYSASKPDELKNLTELFARYGEDRLYLMTSNGYAFLEGDLSGPVTDGHFVLDHLRFVGADGKSADADFMFDYLDAFLHRTSPAQSVALRESRLIDASGKTLLGSMSDDLYGLKVPMTEREIELRDEVLRFAEDHGLTATYSWSTKNYWIRADLPLNADFPEKALELYRDMLSSYSFSTLRSSSWIYLPLTDEDRNGTCRFLIYPAYDFDTGEINMRTDFYARKTDALAPWLDTLMEGWRQTDVESYGFTRFTSIE